LKIVSGKHLCKVLERHGWILQRIHGSHHIYAQAGVQIILTVPVHGNRNLKLGTLRSLMRAARLSENDL
jgi:predicted RNA binding protein YcfA (HicA-like mRNA interferase family)